MSNMNWIGIKNGNRVLYRYCHWGGDLEGNGKVLAQYYTDTDSVKELLAEGDASYIDGDLEHCRFYARDFGENLAPYITDVTENLRPEIASNGRPCFLWNQEQWWVSFNENGKWYGLESKIWFEEDMGYLVTDKKFSGA